MATTVNNADLQLADQVERVGTLGVVTVKMLTDDSVTFFRPYTHTGDFSYTGGVICYVGIETWTEQRSPHVGAWTLLQRKALK